MLWCKGHANGTYRNYVVVQAVTQQEKGGREWGLRDVIGGAPGDGKCGYQKVYK